MQTSNKHIFIVTYDYPPSNGGIARLCFELKKYLEKKGLNVTVIAWKKRNIGVAYIEVFTQKNCSR